MLPAMIVEMLRAHPFYLLTGVLMLLAVALACGRQSVSQRRHRRYQKQAVRALSRLPQLRDDVARFAWLRKMNPYVFEEMLLTALSRQGYRIRRNSSYSGDGGADGQVWIDGQRWLIQAKRYGAGISAAHVADFGQLTAREGCRGLFVHSGRTGGVSRDALRRYPAISLISGQRLLLLLAGNPHWQTHAERAGRSVNASDLHSPG
ncbi:restriction endonuclease [Erwinia psidii]|uniref:Restriction endonuclease n=2 Tax=Erwinia psidii TaxID=69224 RepID=A0A3N6S022_9GAMM|nr:restriction endonuclease [Erwinia psidii]MCX8957029.1 restriction endonuclease [Erwinia psidii]MCX8965287.1 restriction endonuclease [Erwinia psidii]RQM38107.1 restriction endonuclease [Erwinia psidii]